MSKTRFTVLTVLLGSLIPWTLGGHANKSQPAAPAGVAVAAGFRQNRPARPMPKRLPSSARWLTARIAKESSKSRRAGFARRPGQALSLYAAAPRPKASRRRARAARDVARADRRRGAMAARPIITPGGQFQFADFQPPPVQPTLPPVNVQPVFPPPVPGPAGAAGETPGRIGLRAVVDGILPGDMRRRPRARRCRAWGKNRPK